MFWSCPVARAVVDAMQAQLVDLPALTMENIWLLKRPDVGVHAGVWRVVCLAALGAMYRGHRRLYALRIHHDSEMSLAVACQRAGASAVSRMWEALSDFVALQHLPWPAAGVDVGVGHPFIARMHDADGGAARLVVHRV